MVQDNFYSQQILALLYRFLKTYDIPITNEYIHWAFDNHKYRIFIDCMCVNYTDNPALHITSRDTRLRKILDHYWCTFVYNNYDSIMKLITDKPNFVLKTKEEIKDILQRLRGENLLKHMPIETKNKLRLNIPFEFDFSHEKDK